MANSSAPTDSPYSTVPIASIRPEEARTVVWPVLQRSASPRWRSRVRQNLHFAGLRVDSSHSSFLRKVGGSTALVGPFFLAPPPSRYGVRIIARYPPGTLTCL